MGNTKFYLLKSKQVHLTAPDDRRHVTHLNLMLLPVIIPLQILLCCHENAQQRLSSLVFYRSEFTIQRVARIVGNCHWNLIARLNLFKGVMQRYERNVMFLFFDRYF